MLIYITRGLFFAKAAAESLAFVLHGHSLSCRSHLVHLIEGGLNLVLCQFDVVFVLMVAGGHFMQTTE